MSKIITVYLIVTGIGAFIALAMPTLVILGFYLLILPGLILSLMPTAFLYGVIFAAGWVVARMVFGDGIIPVVAGLGTLALVVTTVPMPTRAADLAAYKASNLPDVAPAKPIELQGDLRFNFDNPKTNKSSGPYVKGQAGYACDSYCMAALFTPGVTSVTVDKVSLDDHGKPSADARTYRLARRPECSSNIEIDFNSIHAPLQGEPGSGMDNHEDGKVLVSQWALKLASEFCLVMEPPLQTHDLTITERLIGSTSRSGWGFEQAVPSSQTIEVHRGNSLIYRDHQSSITTLTKPLLIAFSGSGNSSFGWARTTTNSKRGHGSVELRNSLGQATNLAGKPISGASKKEASAEMLPSYRTQLAAALNDPSLTEKSPSFQMMERYFAAIGDTATPQDVELIARLFSDPRITRYEGAWHLKLPADQMVTIYNAYTRRLIRTGAPASATKSMIDKAVQHMGADAIKLIGPDQQALLDDPVKRMAVPELVQALGYGAPDNGRVLFGILKQSVATVADIHRRRQSRELKGYGEQEQHDGHIGVIDAAKTGLCLLAPKDPQLLAQLETYLKNGDMPSHMVDGHAMTDWYVILIRMGMPISRAEKPHNMSGTSSNYLRNLQRKVDNWKPDRCR